jgi:iron complex outermembrane recepter protein
MPQNSQSPRCIFSIVPFLQLVLLYSGQLLYGQETFPDTIDLYPATIIFVRPGTENMEALELDYQDNMAHDGGALLSQLPAIGLIRKGGGYGFDPVLRGFKYEQLNLVLNGAQTASAACPNRMDPPTSQMSPNMIQKIEILKGPYALRYGNAFGATINFISPSPRFSDKKEGYGRVSGRYDSNGNIFRSEGLAGFRSEHINLGLYAAWSQGNDYQTGEGNDIPADFKRASFGAKLGLRLTQKQLLKLSVTRNLARDTDFAALPMDLTKDDTWMFSASHELYPLSGSLKSWKTSLYGSFVDHLMDNLSKPLEPRLVNAITRANTTNYGLRTEGSWSFSHTRLYTGMDYRFEGAAGHRSREFLMGPNTGNQVLDNVWQGGEIQRAGLFVEYHYHGGLLKWVVSGRLNANLADISEPDPEFKNLYPDAGSSQLNPALSLGVTRSFTDKLSLGLWLGRVQRSGSLTERFINYFPVGVDPYEMLGNPLLVPEINNESDITFQWKSKRTNIHLDLFAAYLQDLISSVIDTSLSPRIQSSPGVRRYTNIERAIKTGFEAGWMQKLPAGLQHQFSLAYTYAKDLDRKDPLPEIAPLDLRYLLSGNYFSQRLKPYFSFRYVLEQSRISTEFGETASPSFALIDLGLSFRFTESFRMTAGVSNLFDTLYYEHLSRSVRNVNALPIYAPGRCLFLSFNLDLM